ncbi:AAA family ATPase [Agrobacterium vitis]|uniref:AAA family ATPase n=2 Tax=Agrobacterium vitis TaxID=373 RepID=A0AAE4WA80_AGRVI|nr:AAA family ATPase [Agrobacterium vitis]MCF1498600.1 AAA family ATPase [Allorhizobium sp. Av2]MCM2438281.1 AAA family ATPase [Agrobacterium vitis]MUZ56338.1 AAA family ATPase [Agrobacterium vitis]MVA64525.1 AAA family ATPase [Agrobacterium vitis]MVA85496.1 AAA family ATPase [Agrobacterium vitis]
MAFPVEINAKISAPGGAQNYMISLNSGITVILGPNGSGKTQLMRAAKHGLLQLMGQPGPNGGPPPNKNVRFISAGRIGLLEQYRADYDGHRSGTPLYDRAQYGSKDDASRRHNFETLQGDILTLSQRPDILVKIRERLRKLFQRDVFVEWDAGSLKLSFMRLDGTDTTYSSGREASGLMHLVGLLTALYDDEIGALLIDEPEVSLHPQLQAFLLQEMTGVAGYPDSASNKKIIVLSTHSTEFIKLDTPSDIPQLIFCSDFAAPPVQISPQVGELGGRKVRELVSRMGQEHKLSLFAKSPILVEGPSDAVICGALASKLVIHLEAGGSQVLPVIGKGEFPAVLKLLRLMGKEPVVLADCDGLADGIELSNSFLSTHEGGAVATKRGFASGRELSRSVYSDFCGLVSAYWSEISQLAEQHQYYIAGDPKDEERRRRRAALATILSQSQDQLTELPDRWAAIRARLDVLLSVLEELGCFILRRGTIEDYYSGTDLKEVPSKPDAAVKEALFIQDAEDGALEHSFNDVVRCLRAASSAEKLNEGEALLDLLLSCVAPLQTRLKSGSPTVNANQLARAINGDAAQVFDFTWAEGKILVNLKRKILAVAGFPLSIRAEDNVVEVCSRFLLAS